MDKDDQTHIHTDKHVYTLVCFFWLINDGIKLYVNTCRITAIFLPI